MAVVAGSRPISNVFFGAPIALDEQLGGNTQGDFVRVIGPECQPNRTVELRGPFGRHAFGDLAAEVEDHDLVRDRHDHRHVMLDEQHAQRRLDRLQERTGDEEPPVVEVSLDRLDAWVAMVIIAREFAVTVARRIRPVLLA